MAESTNPHAGAIRTSPDITKLAAAFVSAQAEIQNAAKNATNPHFRSNYADLAEIINTVRPVLNQHGLAVWQFPGLDEHGNALVVTRLVHESGEWVEAISGSPLPKRDPQGVGSATTYLRRYSLAALCGIHQEDDDGNTASKPTRATQDEVAEARRLWLKAKSAGVEKTEPDLMDRAEKTIKGAQKDGVLRVTKWLEEQIAEAETEEAA